MDISVNNDQRSGILATVLFHTILLLILIYFGYRTPLPLPSEQGILINFGTSATGSGDIQPMQKSNVDDVAKTEPTASAAAQPVKSENKVLTQDLEAAPALPKKEATKVKTPVVKPTETKKPVVTNNTTPKEPVKSEPTVNPSAIYTGKKNTTSNTSSGQGNTGGPGDQGDPTGSVNTNGTGKGTAGVSYDLSGRSLRKKPDIEDRSQDFGIVVVDIVVDKYGNVTSVLAPGRGSTTNSLSLVNKAKEAALRAKFNQDLNDLEDRKGSFTFVFSPK